MTLSSPEVSASAWAPEDFAVPLPALAAHGHAPVADPDMFELAAARDIPESVLAPARLLAESAGYAAGWRHGTATAHAAAEHAAEQDRVVQQRIREQERAQVADALTGLRQAARGLAEREAAVADDLEQLVLDTAFGIAEALVGAHLADDEQRGAAVLRRVLALTPPDGPVVVRLSRADHEVVSAQPLPAGVTLVADATLQPGDARASVGATTVDARLGAALERVRGALGRGRAS